MFELAENATLSEKMLMGGKVTLLGLGTVFTILALLYFVLVLFRVVFEKKPSVQSDKTTAVADGSNDSDVNIASGLSAASDSLSEQDEDDEELAAAIIAAISASSGKAPGSFRVVSLKKRR
ncbi:hypothetical protein SDC9_165791 [bioreactor metagenome]|uniref:Oxaloacetate decarboxylase gamma chain n=1 Tax=bioreactor metagenome TaxID=1076179 RepID=A0A645FV86_9ZZZZ|nr:OadG family protein [Oscillospiraceae bacterium]